MRRSLGNMLSRYLSTMSEAVNHRFSTVTLDQALSSFCLPQDFYSSMVVITIFPHKSQLQKLRLERRPSFFPPHGLCLLFLLL
jgi:hypothetical protein